MSLKDRHLLSEKSGLVADNTFTYTVPAGRRWHVLSVSMTLVTSATVGARQMVVEFTDGTNILSTAGRAADQDPSLTRQIIFADSLAIDTSNNITTHPMGQVVLDAADEIIVRDIADIDGTLDTMRILLSVMQEMA